MKYLSKMITALFASAVFGTASASEKSYQEDVAAMGFTITHLDTLRDADGQPWKHCNGHYLFRATGVARHESGVNVIIRDVIEETEAGQLRSTGLLSRDLNVVEKEKLLYKCLLSRQNASDNFFFRRIHAGRPNDDFDNITLRETVNFPQIFTARMTKDPKGTIVAQNTADNSLRRPQYSPDNQRSLEY